MYNKLKHKWITNGGKTVTFFFFFNLAKKVLNPNTLLGFF